MKKFLCVLIFAAMVFTLSSCGNKSDYAEETLAAMSPQEYVDAMGIGINLGNTLDTQGEWIESYGDGSVSSFETAWGNPVTTPEMIEFMHSEGFESIRIPVTWDQHIGDGPDYKIDKDWMDRVEEVVDWALDDGMFVILNLHHDETWIAEAANDYDTVSAKYKAVWEQICERFKNKSYRLMLESNNEVGFSGMSDADGSALLYELNGVFIDTVRSSGGKNGDRMLLLASYNTNIGLALQYFPEDVGDDRYAVSVHQYSPSTFTIASPGTSWGFRDTWGTEADYSDMEREFKALKERFVDNGVPVIVGEYGCSTDGKDQESRELWLSAVVEYSLENDVCPILWDAGGTVDRLALGWKLPGDKEAIMSAAGVAAKNES